MLRRVPIRGTLINTAAVLAGSLLGLLAGQWLPSQYENAALSAIGLLTLVLGVKMSLASPSILLVGGASIIGVLLGTLLGIQPALESFGVWAQAVAGGDGRFSEGLIIATVLFCAGPVTILGCIQDGLENKIELLGFKSILDGVSSIFLAATHGIGVAVSALVLLVIQGALTLGAGRLRGLAEDKEMLDTLTGAGGIILLALGFNILGITTLPTGDFVPALFVGPLLVLLSRRIIPKPG